MSVYPTKKRTEETRRQNMKPIKKFSSKKKFCSKKQIDLIREHFKDYNSNADDYEQ